ncbi:ankyrin repeat and LEM domain-containing protein 1 isoform X2 [Rhineura floridana]|uniref:ankyrin repeat and LEM domain-containing protein 1 isoform X2 n=1 Tax=Rhineura floridana TaxID=261503 RepID=UPI002AC8737D|nr:ankyrin repeat and LEM domain-containing protein 1 isoform X2 [Rhineura floridana]
MRRMVEALLQRGADPNLVLPEGIAAIHLAAGMEQEKGVRCLGLLLQYGGDPNVRSVDGLTPLHVAASWGCYTCLRLLLMEGGDPRLKDQDGNTAIDLASEEGNKMCVHILQGFLEETGQSSCIPWRRAESFLSTVNEDTLDPAGALGLEDCRPDPFGRTPQSPSSESLQCTGPRSPLPRLAAAAPENRPDFNVKSFSFEDKLSSSFLTECSWEPSTLFDQGDLCAQPVVSSSSVPGKVASSPSPARGFPIDRPVHPKEEADVGTTQSRPVLDTTARGCSLFPGPNGVLFHSTLIYSESRKSAMSLEMPNTTGSQEIPGPLPTCAIQSECKAGHIPSTQGANMTLDLSQYNSFLDPDLMVRVASCEGLDVTSPDHTYLFSWAGPTAAVDLEKTVVAPAFLSRACRNLDGCSAGDKSFSGSSDSGSGGRYASCDSECYASTTEAPWCSKAQSHEEQRGSFGCCSPGPHSIGSNNLMHLGLSPRVPVCSSEKQVEAVSAAFSGRVSPARADNLRPLHDGIHCKEVSLNACTGRRPLDLCSTGTNECAGNIGELDFSQDGILANPPLQKRGDQHRSMLPLGETQKAMISGAENECLFEISSFNGKAASWEPRGELKGTVPAEEAWAELNEGERRGGTRGSHCSMSTQDVEEKGERLQTQDTVLIERTPEETKPLLGNENPVSPDTVAVPSQTPPDAREDEPTSLDAKLRSMMLATKICHSPLLRLNQRPCYVTPRTKSRTIASDGHSASSSSSLFDESLETPWRPRRVRSPGGMTPTSGKGQNRVADQGNRGPPCVAEEENGDLDDTVLIGAGPGSCKPASCTGSAPSGSAVSSPAVPASSGRHFCGGDELLDVKLGADCARDLEEELPSEEETLPPRNRKDDCPVQETADVVPSWTDPDQSSARHSRTKRQGRPSRVSFSRLSARGLPSVPRASILLCGNMSPVAQGVPLSPGGRPVNLSATEPVEYLYVDEDKGHSLIERHVPCRDDSVANATGSEDTIIYDWRAYASQALGPVNKVSGPPEATSELQHLSDGELVRRLRDFGVNPGPVTALTRKVYTQLLEKLMSDPKTKARKGSAGYSLELSSALDTYQIPDGKDDEMTLAGQFDQPDKSRKWREGLLKSSFNYLLLDPRVTQNLPFRCQYVSQAECFRTFVSAIFYVGKGKRSRPYCHLYEALAHYRESRRKRGAQACAKVQHILEIWASGQGVISMHCFQNVIPVEAYTREACMVDSVGLKMLTNQKRGNYYGVVAGWPMKRRRCLGVHLLHRAMQIFLAEGERQLRPADIQTGQ